MWQYQQGLIKVIYTYLRIKNNTYKGIGMNKAIPSGVIKSNAIIRIINNSILSVLKGAESKNINRLKLQIIKQKLKQKK